MVFGREEKKHVAMNAEDKSARNQKAPYRILGVLKKADLFAFTPRPQHINGDQVSSYGFAGTFVVFVLVITYLSLSLTRFVNQAPSVSVEAIFQGQSGPLIPLSIALQNPERNRKPSSRRPGLTVDRSYFTISAVLTTARNGEYTAENTHALPLTQCKSEWTSNRRTFQTQFMGYCPEDPTGVCKPSVLCFDPTEFAKTYAAEFSTSNSSFSSSSSSSPPPALMLAKDCLIAPDCSRIELTLATCSEPTVWQMSFLPFTEYHYALPIAGVPPASSWSIQLKANDGTIVNPTNASAQSSFFGCLQVKPDAASSWGFLCNDGFDANETAVMCRTLGLPTTFAWQLSPSSGLLRNMGPNSHYYIDNSGCGNPNSPNFFSDCGFAYYPENITDVDCSYTEAVGIYCGETKPYDFEFALTNSTIRTMGLLNIRPKGTTTWATLRRDNFTQADGMAACRSLGFNVTAAIILPQGTFGEGNAFRYFLYNSRCSTTSTEGLDSCADILYADFRQKTLNEEVALDCSYVYHQQTWEYKLIDGFNMSHDTTSTGKGMVLVRPSATSAWGGVCAFDWNGLAAGAFCRSIGFHVPTARVERPLYQSGFVSLDNIYLERMDCQDPSGLLEGCNSTFFPEGTAKSAHSFDCGQQSGEKLLDLQLHHLSVYGFVDCTHQCADPADIAATATSTSLLLNLSLSLKGKENIIPTGLATSTELHRQTTFMMAPYETKISPDFFYRFSVETFEDQTLHSYVSSTRRVFLTPFVQAEANDTTKSRLLHTAVIQMSSQKIFESQSFQNSADLLGSIYAFYASLIGGFGILLVKWNERKFFRKNPKWKLLNKDLTPVLPDEAEEETNDDDNEESKRKKKKEEEEAQLLSEQEMRMTLNVRNVENGGELDDPLIQ